MSTFINRNLVPFVLAAALSACGGGGGPAPDSNNPAEPIVGATAPLPAPTTTTPVSTPTTNAQIKTFAPICYDSSMQNLDDSGSYRTFGTYNIYSNIWNPGAATSWSQCTGATIASPGGVTVAEFDWNFASTNSDVKTYPNIQFGQQNSYNPSTTPLLPAPLSNLPSLVATGKLATTCAVAPCYFDSSFDVFFSSTSTASPNEEGELMVIADWNFPQPLGPTAFVALNVPIDGATYNIRQFQMPSSHGSWPYVAYYATSPISNLNINIASFAHDAVNRGYIPASYYLDMVEIGTEVLSGQGKTVITNYSVQ